MICYWAAKLESNSFTAVKSQDHTENLTSWQYCRISSFFPKQLLVPEVSGSHFPVWMFTCIFSFPQNMAIWGSATANPVPALAARAYEDKPKQNTLMHYLINGSTTQRTRNPLASSQTAPAWSRISVESCKLFCNNIPWDAEPTPSFHQQGICFPKLCFYNWNNSLPKPRVIPTKRLHLHGVKQMSEKLTK